MAAFLAGELGWLIGTAFDPRVWLMIVLCGALGYYSVRRRWVLVFAAVLTAISTYDSIGYSAALGREPRLLAFATHTLADYLILAYLAYFIVKFAAGRPPVARATTDAQTHADKTVSP